MLYCTQKLLMCVYFQIKLSIIQSLANTKEKLEQAKHDSQMAEGKSTNWYHLNSRHAWDR